MATGYHVYGNGGSGGPVDYSTVIATVSGLAYTPAPLGLSSNWTFAVRAYDTASGLEESNVDARCSIVIDASGNDATLTPMPATLIGLIPTAGGTLRVDWSQVSPGTQAKAASFAVYLTAGSTVNVSVPPALTVAASGKMPMSATLAGLADGARYAVLVRSIAATGLHSDSGTMTAIGSATPPTGVMGLSVTATT